MMQKAADALNAYLERNSTLANRLHWTRTRDGYVIYSGVTKTHDEEGRMLITPVHRESRVVAENAREAIAFAAMDDLHKSAQGPVPSTTGDGKVSSDNIADQLESVTRLAKTRMAECNPGIAGVMGGAEIDFMTSEEKALRHRLLLSLPGAAQLRLEAKNRIAKRIQERRQTAEAFANKLVEIEASQLRNENSRSVILM